MTHSAADRTPFFANRVAAPQKALPDALATVAAVARGLDTADRRTGRR